MLHSVVDDGTFYPDASLRCPVTKLEWALRWLKAQGLEFVSLDEVVERLSGPPAPAFAAFTFDDGFADNLTHALPVMERFGAPFTVYVTTGMVTRQIHAWWLALAALVRSQEWIELPDLALFECPDRASKMHTFKAISPQSTMILACSLTYWLRSSKARSIAAISWIGRRSTRSNCGAWPAIRS